MGVTPGQSAPDGAFVISTTNTIDNQTESSVRSFLKAGTIGSFEAAEAEQDTQIKDPINVAQGTADNANSGVAEVKYGTPLWNGIDATAEVTIPYASNVTAFTVNQANARGGFVRLQGGDEKRVFTWLGSGNTSITNAYIDVYAMDPATGDLELFHQSPDLHTSLIASQAWHQYSMDAAETGYVGTKGDIIYVELRVIGAGSHTIYGKTMTGGTPLSGVFPAKLGAVRDGGANTTSPASIAFASYTETDDVPFIEVATDHGQDDVLRSWFDNFNRANGGLGANWISRSTTSSQLIINSNKVRYNGSTDGTQAGLWLYPMTTDKVYLEFNLAGLGGGTGEVCAFISSDNLMTNLCAVRVDNTTVEIATGSYSSMTDRAATTHTAAVGDNYSLQYEPLTKVFDVYKNGSASPIVTWTDSTDIVTHGVGRRFVGIICNRVPFNSSGEIGSWLCRDVN